MYIIRGTGESDASLDQLYDAIARQMFEFQHGKKLFDENGQLVAEPTNLFSVTLSDGFEYIFEPVKSVIYYPVGTDPKVLAEILMGKLMKLSAKYPQPTYTSIPTFTSLKSTSHSQPEKIEYSVAETKERINLYFSRPDSNCVIAGWIFVQQTEKFLTYNKYSVFIELFSIWIDRWNLLKCTERHLLRELQLDDFVDFEKICCPHFTFNLTSLPGYFSILDTSHHNNMQDILTNRIKLVRKYRTASRGNFLKLRNFIFDALPKLHHIRVKDEKLQLIRQEVTADTQICGKCECIINLENVNEVLSTLRINTYSESSRCAICRILYELVFEFSFNLTNFSEFNDDFPEELQTDEFNECLSKIQNMECEPIIDTNPHSNSRSFQIGDFIFVDCPLDYLLSSRPVACNAKKILCGFFVKLM